MKPLPIRRKQDLVPVALRAKLASQVSVLPRSITSARRAAGKESAGQYDDVSGTRLHFNNQPLRDISQGSAESIHLYDLTWEIPGSA